MSSVVLANNKVARPAGLAIPESVNIGLMLLHTGANLFQFFILPIYFLSASPWWALALVPIAALNNPLWALMHEAIHDAFNSSVAVNRAAGRWLSVIFGSPFQILRLTHLSHHKFNRSPLEKGTEMYESKQSSKWVASLKYFFYILCGVYLLEVFSVWLFILPKRMFGKFGARLLEQGDRQEKWLAAKFLDDNRQREIRIDGLVIFLLFGASAYFYRGHWIAFAGMIGARALLVSLMDNIYHYGTPIKVTLSGHNLSLPRFLSAGVLNFNYHRIHHTHPNVPWTGLPRLYAQSREHCDANFFVALLNQFRGPLSIEELQPQPRYGENFGVDPSSLEAVQPQG
jgi:fatty acid desaturase